MDLIVDSFGHAILVIVERMTNFVMMEKLPHGKKAAPLAKTVVRMLYGDRKYLKTITTDNGSEFAAHLDISAGLRVRGMLTLRSISPTAIALGRKAQSSMRTNSFASTSPKIQFQ